MSCSIEGCEAGQRWYVRRPGATVLVEAEIVEKTAKTIAVKMVDIYAQIERYEHRDIEFIERLARGE